MIKNGIPESRETVADTRAQRLSAFGSTMVYSSSLLIVLLIVSEVTGVDYESVGCFKDTGNRAIPTIEGKDAVLDGPYRNRKNAIAKCAAAARKRGFNMFALQHGGWCATSATAEKTFDKYGKSGACQGDGEGGAWANEVYIFKDYKSVGCYKDTGNRAIPTIEGKEAVLDGPYRNRKNAIAKCAAAARKRGFHMFALQHGGWCAASATAENTYDKYGKSGACQGDGEGGPWGNEVYVLEDYKSVGCYKDTGNRAIPTIEGKDAVLDGPYRNRKNAIAKCAAAARKRGFNMFALQHGGWCASSATAEKTFDKYGKSGTCQGDGEGGPWGNEVYIFKDYKSVGCYKDTGNRAIPTIEGKDAVLDGPYRNRKNAIAKCAAAARKRGFNMFALQHGGWCASSATAEKTFDKYGKSGTCQGDGEGGPWGNEVYIFKDYKSVGCYRDTGNRAIPTIEGKDAVLDGPYRDRNNAIAKCAAAARKRGFHMFALQHGGWCAASATAEKTFDKYGKSGSCQGDGEGGPWANNVYVLEDYKSVGCYRDTGNRAIPTIEGKDAVLDGPYRDRNNAIAKCAAAARKRGFHMFALQHGGWCAASATAEKTFDKYGKSGACQGDGEGGPWANNVYVLEDYKSVGCYRDTGNRAIPTIEGKDAVLDGPYRDRNNAIAKCAAAARKRGFHMFALQHGGWCAASATAEKTFDKYGKSGSCQGDGEGGPWANNVYVLEDYKSVGCYRDTGNRAITTIEGKDAVLDGPYRDRFNAIAKCAAAARKRGFNMFALQHGGWCATSATAEKTFDKYGKSGACQEDGEGGPWANDVYTFQVQFADIKEYAPAPCKNGTTCADLVGSYRCDCKSVRSGNNCKKNIDECAPAPCKNGATCVDLVASYRCDCVKGYTGNNCETNINDCSPDLCANGGTCVDLVGGYRCNCKPGYNGNNCRTNIDECAPAPCKNGATCVDLVASYRCDCVKGYTGNNCETNINECSPDPCKNGGTCVDLVGSYRCNCKPGYNGNNCEMNIDECAPAPCKNGATCVDLVGSYRCDCATGYSGNNCETNINECAPAPCKNGGTCVDLFGSYRCDCKAGYNGNNCETNINECAPAPCKNGATCVDLVGSYRCDCVAGYTGSNCETNINECAPNPCNNGATCVDLVGSYRCDCAAGYTGSNCETNINDCSPDPCKNGATCVDLVGSHRCDCMAGYTGSNCETNINECAPDPCNNGATCVDLVGSYRCDCKPGYTGSNCETNINDCSPDPCKNGATCVDLVGSHRCDCMAGYTGSNCETNINDCSPDPCKNGATCVDLVESHRCDCMPGYSGSNCETNIMINNCSPDPCKNGATCVDLGGSHRCDCMAGYTGSNCETNIDECAPAPCKNGGTCVDLVGSYRCDCTAEFIGLTCEEALLDECEEV